MNRKAKKRVISVVMTAAMLLTSVQIPTMAKWEIPVPKEKPIEDRAFDVHGSTNEIDAADDEVNTEADSEVVEDAAAESVSGAEKFSLSEQLSSKPAASSSPTYMQEGTGYTATEEYTYDSDDGYLLTKEGASSEPTFMTEYNGTLPEEFTKNAESGSIKEFESEEVRKFIEEMYAEGLTQENSAYDLSSFGAKKDETPDYNNMTDAEILKLFDEKNSEHKADEGFVFDLMGDTNEEITETKTEEPQIIEETVEEVTSAPIEDTNIIEETQPEDEYKAVTKTEEETKVVEKKRTEKVPHEGTKTTTTEIIGQEPIVETTTKTVTEEVVTEKEMRVETVVESAVEVGQDEETGEPIYDTVEQTTYKTVTVPETKTIEKEISEEEVVGTNYTVLETVTSSDGTSSSHTYTTTSAPAIGTVVESFTTYTEEEIIDYVTETVAVEKTEYIKQTAPVQTTAQTAVQTSSAPATTVKSTGVSKTKAATVKAPSTVAKTEDTDISAMADDDITLMEGTENLGVTYNADSEMLEYTEDGATVPFKYVTLQEGKAYNLGLGSGYTYHVIDERFVTASAEGVLTSVAGVYGKTPVVVHTNEGQDDDKTALIMVSTTTADGIASPMIAAGYEHAMALRTDGKIYAWGRNNYGQLGINSSAATQLTPAVVLKADGSELSNIVEISADRYGSVALDKEGTVYVWGQNTNYRFGNGNTTATATLNVATPLTTLPQKIKDISSGGDSVFAVAVDGTVYGWGYGVSYKLGNNATADQASPVEITDLGSDTMYLRSGQYATIALKQNGRVYGAGRTNDGKLGEAITTGKYSYTTFLQLKKGNIPSDDDYAKNIVLLSASDDSYSSTGYRSQQNLLVDENGDLYAAGTGVTFIKDSTAKSTYSVFTKSDSITGVVSASAYGYSSNYSNALYALSDGTVAVAGYNGNLFPTAAQADALTGVGQVVLTRIYKESNCTSYALKTDGTVWMYGASNYGQRGDGITYYQNTGFISAGGDSVTNLFARYGETYKISDNSAVTDSFEDVFDDENGIITTTYIDAAEKFVIDLSKLEISAGGINLIMRPAVELNMENLTASVLDERIANAEIADGKLIITGVEGAYGITTVLIKESALGLSTRFRIGVRPEGAAAVPMIAAGCGHVLALRADGSVWGWGYNQYGQVGNRNTTTPVAAPVQVLTDVIYISADYYMSLAVKKDGTVWTWGYSETNSSNQRYRTLGRNGTGYANSTPQQVSGPANIVMADMGYYGGNAVAKDGTVWGWGAYTGFNSNSAELPAKITISNVIQISTYNNSGAALLANGLVKTVKNVMPSYILSGDIPSESGYAEGISYVSAGDNHTALLTDDGHVYFNGQGYKDNGAASADATVPTGPAATEDVVQVNTSNFFTSYLKKDGTVWTLGSASMLGNGSTAASNVAVQASGLENVYVLDASNYSSSSCYMAGDRSGNIYGWGSNGYKQLLSGTTSSTSYVPVDLNGTDVSMRLTDSDGNFLYKVSVTEGGEYDLSGINGGMNNTGTFYMNLLHTTLDTNAELTSFKIVNDNLAKVSDGKITAENNVTGRTQLVVRASNGQRAVTNLEVLREGAVAVPKIEVTTSLVLALRSDGTVWSWNGSTTAAPQIAGLGRGNNADGTVPGQVMLSSGAYLTDIVDIAALTTNNSGSFYGRGYAVSADGKLYNWGYLSSSSIIYYATATTLTNIVATNGLYSVAKDGSLYSGTTKSTLLSDIVGFNSDDGGFGMKQSGHVFLLTSKNSLNADIANKTVQVEGTANNTSNYPSFYLTEDGDVYGIGSASAGEFGTGTEGTVKLTGFTKLEGLSGITSVAYNHVAKTFYALNKNGIVYAAGQNTAGQLGLGSDDLTTKYSFTTLPVTDVQSMRSCYYYSNPQYYGAFFVIKNDGTVWGTGGGYLMYGGANAGKTFKKITHIDDSLKLKTAEGEPLTHISLEGGKTYSINTDGVKIKVGLNVIYSAGEEYDAEGPFAYRVMDERLASVSADGVITAKDDIYGETQVLVTDAHTGVSSVISLSTRPEGAVATPKVYSYLDSNGTISCGYALKSDGTVWGWGHSYGGVENSTIAKQLVYETTEEVEQEGGGTTTQTVYVPLTNIVNLFSSGLVSYAIDADGSVWGWGSNIQKLITNTSDTTISYPIKLTSEDLHDIKEIYVLNNQSVFMLRDDGTIWAWGYTNLDSLGTGNTTQSTTISVPTRVTKAADIEDVVKMSNSYALLANGQIVYMNKSNDNTTKVSYNFKPLVTTAMPTDTGYAENVVGIDSDSTYVVTEDGEAYSDLSTKVDIDNVLYAAGSSSNGIFIKTDGTVWIRGTNSSGQFGNGETSTTNVTTPVEIASLSSSNAVQAAISSSGGLTSTVLSGDGSIWKSGKNAEVRMSDLKTIDSTEFKALPSGESEMFIYGADIMENGSSVRTFTKKDPFMGILLGGEAITDNQTVVLDKDEFFSNMLFNLLGRASTPINRETIVMLSLNESLATIENGNTIVPNSDKKYGVVPIIIKDLELDITKLVRVQIIPAGKKAMPSVVVGNGAMFAVKADGTLWAWGANTCGALGTGDAANSNIPVQVHGGESGTEYLDNIVQVIAVNSNYSYLGYNNVFALKRDGTVYSWGGSGTQGEHGDGKNEHKHLFLPVRVLGGDMKTAYLKDIVEISYTSSFGLAALDRYGRVWITGPYVYNYNYTTYKADYTPKRIGAEYLNNVVQVQGGYAIKHNSYAYPVYDYVTTPVGNASTGYIDKAYGMYSYRTGSSNSHRDAQYFMRYTLEDTAEEIVSGGNTYYVPRISARNIYASGTNNEGQLGNGTTSDTSTTTFAPVLTAENTPLDNVVEVSAGMARTENGDLYTWGKNDVGQLGIGSTENSLYAVRVVGGETGDEYLSNVITASKSEGVSNGNGAAVLSDYSIYSWGYDYGNVGILGNGKNISETSTNPVRVVSVRETDIDMNLSFRIREATLTRGGESQKVKLGYDTITLSDNTINSAVQEGDEIKLNIAALGAPGNAIFTNKFLLMKDEGEIEDDPSADASDYTFKSLNENVASIDENGVISALKTGVTYITAQKNSGEFGYIKVNVVPKRDTYIAYPKVDGDYALKADGTLWTDLTNVPVQVMLDQNTPLTDIIKFSGKFALTKYGTVYSWSEDNGSGSYSSYSNAAYIGGDGITSYHSNQYPVKVVGPSYSASNRDTYLGDGNGSGRIVDIAPGAAVDEDGNLYTWGTGIIDPQVSAARAVPKNISPDNERLNGISAVRKGYNAVYVLRGDGNILSWGAHRYGSAGNGDGSDTGGSLSSYPVVFAELGEDRAKAVNMHINFYSGMAITTEGKVYGWGSNEGKIFGSEAGDVVVLPIEIDAYSASEDNVPVSLYSDWNSYIGGVLSSDGTVTNMGSSTYTNGNIDIRYLYGRGTRAVTTTPGRVLAPANETGEYLENIIASDNSYGIKSDGSVYLFGQQGKTAIPQKIGKSNHLAPYTYLNSMKKGEELEHLELPYTLEFNVFQSFGVQIDDSVEPLFWQTFDGRNDIVEVDKETGRIRAVGVGTTYIIVSLQRDIGINTALKVEVRPADDEVEGGVSVAFPQVAAGEDFSVALHADGTVWTWGDNSTGQLGLGTDATAVYPKQIQGLTDVVKIAAAAQFALALKSDGSVYAWGNIPLYDTNGNFTSVSKSPARVLGGEQGGAYLEDIVAISASWNGVGLVADKFGNAYQFGKYSPVIRSLPKVSGIIDVKASKSPHGLRYYLANDGSMYSAQTAKYYDSPYISENDYGSGTDSVLYFGKLNLADKAYAIGAADNIGAAMTYSFSADDEPVLSNKLYMWGDNSNKAIDTSGSNYRTPVEIKDVSDVVSVGGGSSVYLMQAGDSRVYTSGLNSSGQLAHIDSSTTLQAAYNRDGEELTDIIGAASSHGGEHTLFVDKTGKVWSTGSNLSAQLALRGIGSSVDKAYPIGEAGIIVKSRDVLAKVGVLSAQALAQSSLKDAESGFNLIKFTDEHPNYTYSYNVWDESVASVDENGYVTGGKVGQTFAEITVTNADTLEEVNRYYVKISVVPDDDSFITFPQVEISYDKSYVMALKADGTVWAWGNGQYGKLGNGKSSGNALVPQQISFNGAKIKKISIVDYAAAALDTEGNLYTWGANQYGILGYGNNNGSTTPKKVQYFIDNDIKVKDISLYKSSSTTLVNEYRNNTLIRQYYKTGYNKSTALAVDENGAVYGWGYNGDGRFINYNNSSSYLTKPVYAGITGAVAVTGADHTSTEYLGKTYALLDNGELYSWGESKKPSKVDLGERIADIHAVSNGAIAVGGESKDTFVWGSGSQYNLGRAQSGGAAAASDTLGGAIRLTNNGVIKSEDQIIISTENNKDNQEETPVGALMKNSTDTFTNAIWLAENPYAAIANDGGVYVWGNNSYGQLGRGETSKGTITYPETVGSMPYVLHDENGIELTHVDGTGTFDAPTIIAGFNVFNGDIRVSEDYSVVSSDTNVVTVDKDTNTYIAVGVGKARIIIRDNIDNLYTTKEIQVLPTAFYDEHEYKVFPEIATGSDFTIALKANGTVWTWGNNESGQLGISNETPLSSPQPVQVLMSNGDPLTHIVSVAAGSKTGYAVTSEGNVYAWGLNNYGLLGRDSPSQTLVLRGAQKVLSEDGEGSLGDSERVIRVRAGYGSVVAITEAGTVYAWGNNDKGQLGVGSTNKYSSLPVKVTAISDIIDAAVGDANIAFLTRRANVYAAGDNWGGAEGQGTTTSTMYRTPQTVKKGDSEILAGVADVSANSRKINYSVFEGSELTNTVYDTGYYPGGYISSASTSDMHAYPTIVSDVLSGLTATAPHANYAISNEDASRNVYTWWASGKTKVQNTEGSGDITNIMLLGASSDSSHAIAADATGAVYGWGTNAYGQLGNNTTDPSDTPVTVLSLVDGEDKIPFSLFNDFTINTGLSSVKVNETEAEYINGTYTYFLKETDSADTAAVIITADDEASTIKVEAITEDTSTTPYTPSYTQIGGEVATTWTDDTVELHTPPVNKYRITVKAAGGVADAEYTLIIRGSSNNTDVEYVKVGDTQAEKGEDGVWTITLPDNTKEERFTIKAADGEAMVSVVRDSEELAEADIADNRGKLVDYIAGIEFDDKDEDYKYFKVVSQDGTASKVYSIHILGNESEPLVGTVTVNGIEAEAVTDEDTGETYYVFNNVQPSATEAEVAVTAQSRKHNVTINNGEAHSDGYGLETIDVTSIPDEGLEVPFTITNSDGTNTITSKIILKKLGNDFGVTITVKETGSENSSTFNSTIDGAGPYSYTVSAEAETFDLSAIAAEFENEGTPTRYKVVVHGPTKSADNAVDTGLEAELTDSLTDIDVSNITEVTIIVAADSDYGMIPNDELSDNRVAEYKLKITKKSNNTNIVSVTANPDDESHANTDTSDDDFVNIGTGEELNYVTAYHVFTDESKSEFTLEIDFEKPEAIVKSLNGAAFTGTNEDGKARVTLSGLTKNFVYGDADSYLIPITVASGEDEDSSTQDYAIIVTPVSMALGLAASYTVSGETQSISNDENGEVQVSVSTLGGAVIELTADTPDENDVITYITKSDDNTPDFTVDGDYGRHTLNITVSDMSNLTDETPYTYNVEVSKGDSGFKQTYRLVLKPLDSNTDITVTVNGVKANWLNVSGGYYDGSIDINAEEANIVVTADSDQTKVAVVERIDPIAVPEIKDLKTTTLLRSVELTEGIEKTDFEEGEEIGEYDDGALYYLIYVKPQDGSNTENGYETKLLRIARRESGNGIQSIKRLPDEDAEVETETSEEGIVNTTYVFFVDSTRDVPTISIESDSGSTIRVGYYDENNDWHDMGASDVSNASAGWTTDNKWQDELLSGANDGKYVIEVGSAAGDIKTYPLEFRIVSDTANIDAMVTESGKVGQYNITVVNEDGYSEAHVPNHEFDIDINLENKYTTITSIHIVKDYEQTDPYDPNGEPTLVTEEKGSYTYRIPEGVAINDTAWLAIELQPQKEGTDTVFRYLKMTGKSDDLTLKTVTVNTEPAAQDMDKEDNLLRSYTYILTVDNAENAAIALETNYEGAAITAIDGAVSAVPTNTWNNDEYALNDGESTSLTADVRSQLYVDAETTPNAFTTYTLNIYKKNTNSGLGEIKAEYEDKNGDKQTVIALPGTEDNTFDLWIPKGVDTADITAITDAALAKVKVDEKPTEDAGYSLNTDTEANKDLTDGGDIKVYVKASSAEEGDEPTEYTVKLHTLDLSVKTDDTGEEIGISASADKTTYTPARKDAEKDDTYKVTLADVSDHTASAKIETSIDTNYVRIGYITKPDGSDAAALSAFNTLAQDYDETAEGFTWTEWTQGTAASDIGLVETEGAHTMVKMQVSAVSPVNEETQTYLYKTYNLLINEPYDNADIDIYVNTRDTGSIKQMTKLTEYEEVEEEGTTYKTYTYNIPKSLGSSEEAAKIYLTTRPQGVVNPSVTVTSKSDLDEDAVVTENYDYTTGNLEITVNPALDKYPIESGADVNDTVINITSTAESGKTINYRVIVKRSTSDEAKVKAATVNETEAVSSETVEGVIKDSYTVTTDTLTEDENGKKYIRVRIEATDADAEIEIGGNTYTGTADAETEINGEKVHGILIEIPDENTPQEIHYTITSVDGKSTQQYVMNVTIEMPEKTFLDMLLLNKGTIVPTFMREIKDYYVTVPYDVNEVELTTHASAAENIIKVENETYTAPKVLSLTAGIDNVFHINLFETSASENAANVYTLNIYRKKNAEKIADLETLEIDGNTLTTEFSARELNYYTYVSADTKQATITAAAVSEDAVVTGTGEVTLTGGRTEQVITVTNGTTVQRYSVTFIKETAGSDAVITFNGNTLTNEPNQTVTFDSAGNATINVTAGTDSIITVNGKEIENGADTVFTVTTAKERFDISVKSSDKPAAYKAYTVYAETGDTPYEPYINHIMIDPTSEKTGKDALFINAFDTKTFTYEATNNGTTPYMFATSDDTESYIELFDSEGNDYAAASDLTTYIAETLGESNEAEFTFRVTKFTANGNELVNDYKVKVYNSDGPILSDIWTENAYMPDAFDPLVKEYNVLLDSEETHFAVHTENLYDNDRATVSMNIDDGEYVEGESREFTDLPTDTETFTVKVKITVDGTDGYYTLNVTRSDNVQPDTLLESIVLTDETVAEDGLYELVPEFANTTAKYTTTINYVDNTIELTVTAKNPETDVLTVVTGDGSETELTSGVAQTITLPMTFFATDDAAEKVYVKVKDSDNKTGTYTITVSRDARKGSENSDSAAKLKSLTTDVYDLTDIFDSDVYFYTIKADTPVKVTAEANNAENTIVMTHDGIDTDSSTGNAEETITISDTGTDYIFITVAEPAFTYVLKVERENSLNLSSLLVTDTNTEDDYEVLNPEFVADTDAYEVSITPLAKEIEFEIRTTEETPFLMMKHGNDKVTDTEAGDGYSFIKKKYTDLPLDEKTFTFEFIVSKTTDGKNTSGKYTVTVTRDAEADTATVQTYLTGTVRSAAGMKNSGALIKLYDTNDALVELKDGNNYYEIPDTGLFAVEVPAEGTYSMEITRMGYLSHTVKDIVVESTFVRAQYNFGNIWIKPGDVDESGEIDRDDVEIINKFLYAIPVETVEPTAVGEVKVIDADNKEQTEVTEKTETEKAVENDSTEKTAETASGTGDQTKAADNTDNKPEETKSENTEATVKEPDVTVPETAGTAEKSPEVEKSDVTVPENTNPDADGTKEETTVNPEKSTDSGTAPTEIVSEQSDQTTEETTDKSVPDKTENTDPESAGGTEGKGSENAASTSDNSDSSKDSASTSGNSDSGSSKDSASTSSSSDNSSAKDSVSASSGSDSGSSKDSASTSSSSDNSSAKDSASASSGSDSGSSKDSASTSSSSGSNSGGESHKLSTAVLGDSDENIVEAEDGNSAYYIEGSKKIICWIIADGKKIQRDCSDMDSDGKITTKDLTFALMYFGERAVTELNSKALTEYME